LGRTRTDFSVNICRSGVNEVYDSISTNRYDIVHFRSSILYEQGGAVENGKHYRRPDSEERKVGKSIIRERSEVVCFEDSDVLAFPLR
jgi:hypothetical protein